MGSMTANLLPLVILIDLAAHTSSMSSDLSLSSHPEILQGRHFCPDVSIELLCEARNVSNDIIRWLYSKNGKNYTDVSGTQLDTVKQVPYRVDLAEAAINELPGVEIYITSIQKYTQRSFSFMSLLYINTSLFRNFERVNFTCGNYSVRSKAINLELNIQYPVPPFVKGLTATYVNNSLYSLAAHWQHSNLSREQNLSCSYVYVVEVFLENAESNGLYAYHIIPYSNCSEAGCSTSFIIDKELDSNAEFNVSILSTDSILKYNSTIVTFSKVVPYLIYQVINYSITAPTDSCSPISVSCWPHLYNTSTCTFKHRIRDTDEKFTTMEISANTTVAIASVRKFAENDFILAAETENGSFAIKVLGKLSSYPNVARLTSANKALLSLAVIMFLLCLLLLSLDGFLIKKSFPTVPRILQVVSSVIIIKQSVLVVVMVSLFIATGVSVSAQEDLCNSGWKLQRDGTIVALFVLTLYLLIVAGVFTLLLIYISYKEEIFNFYYSKKKHSTIATTHTSKNSRKQKSREGKKSQQVSQDSNKKKNEIYNLEYFDGPSRNTTGEDVLYDLPDDAISIRSHNSQKHTQKDGHLYDDVDDFEKPPPSYTCLDKSTVVPKTIYDLPLDNEDDLQARGTNVEEKFYESINEEESEDEEEEEEEGMSEADRIARERALQEERNEREIKEALRKRRLLKLTNARQINTVPQTPNVGEHAGSQEWLYRSGDIQQ